MTAHSSPHRKLISSHKGYAGIIAAIIMVLIILYFYSTVAMFSLSRDKDLQDITARSAQLDVDRDAEKVAITSVTITQGPQAGQLTVTCTLENSGPVPVQLARLWLKDESLTQNNIGNVPLASIPVTIQPGGRIQQTFPPVAMQGSSPSDTFFLWIITFRGNSLSQITN